MGMRVRGKATARPDKVGGPTSDAGGSGRIPDSLLKNALAVPNVEDFSGLVFPGPAAPGHRRRRRGAAKCRSISRSARQFAAPARMSRAICIIPQARAYELRSGEFP